MKVKLALTYDDIQLIPNHSKIASRSKVSLKTKVSRNYSIDIPLVSAPMDTVCESEMANALMWLGGVGCIHRFCTIKKQVEEVEKVFRTRSKLYTTSQGKPIMAAIGAVGDYFERAIELVHAGVDILVIDVAHGDHENVKLALNKLKKELPNSVDIIAGNIATAESAIRLENWGADGLRVGIGGGSVCTTRVKTGFGVPNVTSILDVTSACTVPVMADGGIRSSGDIAKALAVGADCVMIGSLLSGTDETPLNDVIIEGKRYQEYRGLASAKTKSVHSQKVRNVEGAETLVLYKGSVTDIVEDLLDGVRSALSYAGADNIVDFTATTDFVQVTTNGHKEGTPHLLG